MERPGLLLHQLGRIRSMRRVLALVIAATLFVGLASPALASQPSGQLGYGGQPGNQGGGGSGHGLLGYEGQPGNQGG